MPDFIQDLVIGRWEYALENTELSGATTQFSTSGGVARSTSLGFLKVRRGAVYYAEILTTPRLDSLTPDSGQPGDSDTTVILTGSFSPSDTAYWSGTPLATTYLNSATLSVTVPSSLLAAGECGAIEVANEAGATSNALNFDVCPGSGGNHGYFL
jgi:hypothetical protein